MKKQTTALQSIVQLVLLVGIAIFANILASFFYGDIDLTEDQRFTLNEATYRLVESLDDDVAIEIYLEGDFPSSFKHLQGAVKDILDKFRSRTDKIQYRFVDPLSGNAEENQEMAKKLRDQGIMPVNLTISSKGSRQAKLVFPAAIIRYKNTYVGVNLLENMGSVNTDYTNMASINASINLLEYKLASAIQKLQRTLRPKVVLLTGHGELQRPFTHSFEKSLYEYYDIARLDLDKVTHIDTAINVLVVAKPRGPFPDKHQFMLDQYLMNGGNLIWLVDRIKMDDDSLRAEGFHIPNEYPLNIHDMLFNYGVRINTKMVLDWESTKIPMQVGVVNGKPQIDLRKWYYHPRVFPYTTPKEAYLTGKSMIDHPIVKNIDYVDTRYPTNLDTLITRTAIKKTILLRSSKYSKYQMPPIRIGFDIIDAGITQEAFNKGNQDVAVLLEGEFESHFRNRIPPEMLQGLQQLGQPFRERSRPAKMIVVSDGDIIRNEMDYKSGQPLPLGYNRFENYMYGNKDFIMNAVEYMIDDDGIIAARGKEIKLRPLDQERAFREETKWRLINLGLPLVILILFGFVYIFIRRKRFGYHD